jgi:hypothetical protein
MRKLLRKPLSWMVLAECGIVAALILVAWHLVADPPNQSAVPAFVSQPSESGDGGAQTPAGLAEITKPRSAPTLPGLNLEASFWRLRLAELNRGEAAFEALEWRLVHSAMDAAHRYIRSVVLPSIARAERRP